MGTDKITRILILYRQLLRGEYINKTLFASEHDITERSFDRDIEDLRIFLSEIYSSDEVLFDKQNNSYYLTGQAPASIGEVEIMALSKILLGSGAFRKDEAEGLLSALCSTLPKSTRNIVIERLQQNIVTYKAAENDTAILKTVWDLSTYILREKKLNIKYRQESGEVIALQVAPVDIVFAEHWFWLVAYDGEGKAEQPERYRVDRLVSVEVADVFYSREIKARYRKNYNKEGDYYYECNI